MGGKKVWNKVGRVTLGLATGGASEAVNAAKGGKVFGDWSGKDGSSAPTTSTTKTTDGDNIEKTEGASGTAEGGEDIYSSGAMALKKKKSTLIGSGDNTFSSTLGA